MIRVLFPTHLRSYLDGAAEVMAEGATVGEVLADVERRHRGFLIRVVDEQDRIRPHIKVFVGGELAADLHAPIVGDVQLIAALSGG